MTIADIKQIIAQLTDIKEIHSAEQASLLEQQKTITGEVNTFILFVNTAFAQYKDNTIPDALSQYIVAMFPQVQQQYFAQDKTYLFDYFNQTDINLWRLLTPMLPINPVIGDPRQTFPLVACLMRMYRLHHSMPMRPSGLIEKLRGILYFYLAHEATDANCCDQEHYPLLMSAYIAADDKMFAQILARGVNLLHKNKEHQTLYNLLTSRGPTGKITHAYPVGTKNAQKTITYTLPIGNDAPKITHRRKLPVQIQLRLEAQHNEQLTASRSTVGYLRQFSRQFEEKDSAVIHQQAKQVLVKLRSRHILGECNTVENNERTGGWISRVLTSPHIYALEHDEKGECFVDFYGISASAMYDIRAYMRILLKKITKVELHSIYLKNIKEKLGHDRQAQEMSIPYSDSSEACTLVQLFHEIVNANLSRSFRAGNCDVRASTVMVEFLLRCNQYRVEHMSANRTAHFFILVNRSSSSELNDPTSWGKSCFVIDSYKHVIFPAQEMLGQYRHTFYDYAHLKTMVDVDLSRHEPKAVKLMFEVLDQMFNELLRPKLHQVDAELPVYYARLYRDNNRRYKK